MFLVCFLGSYPTLGGGSPGFFGEVKPRSESGRRCLNVFVVLQNPNTQCMTYFPIYTIKK